MKKIFSRTLLLLLLLCFLFSLNCFSQEAIDTLQIEAVEVEFP